MRGPHAGGLGREAGLSALISNAGGANGRNAADARIADAMATPGKGCGGLLSWSASGSQVLLTLPTSAAILSLWRPGPVPAR